MSGLTDFTNPYIWMGMGPYAWSSNYGYEMQLNVLPEYATPQEARLFHGILNPNHVSQWNPLFSIPIQNNVTNPALTRQGLQQAYDWGKNRMAEIMDGMNFNEATKNLGTIKGQFGALIKDKNLNDEQKAEIQKIIDEAKALEKKLSEYKKAMQKPNADKDALREDFKQIQEDIKTLHDKAANVIETIKEELSGTEAPEAPENPEGTEPPAAEEKPEQPKTEIKPQSVVKTDGTKIEGEAGPNGTIIKEGKYYSAYDGTELNAQYALGTEMKLKDGYSARVWANGENVLYRDNTGKQLTPVQFAEKYPDEYLNVMSQQFMNAVPEIADKITASIDKDTSGKILTVKFTYNGKEALEKAPVNVKEILKRLGLSKSQQA